MAFGLLQLVLFLILLLLLTKWVGTYLYQVLDVNRRTFMDPLLKPMERLIYKVFRIDPGKEQDWKEYTVSLLCFSLIGLLFTYTILRLQHVLPLNPQGFGPVASDLAFNTAASFTTNTNWQNYAGESTLSYFSQMVGLTFHNFSSAAVGIAVAAALVRGIACHSLKTVGNFWTDLIRIHLYLLIPLSLVFAVFLVSQGMIQNFGNYQRISPLETVQTNIAADQVVKEEKAQVIPQGPVASQVAIKMLGTNGGGFFNANAAHPYENPTPLTNFLQILSIFLIPGGLTYYLGKMVGKQRHGWTIWAAMAILFIAVFLVCWAAETAGNPRLHELGINQSGGNMEGKEARFGTFSSALFATVTTAASCGAVNSMHDSFTPLGGFVPLFNIQLGEVVFGGVGAGLYGMLIFVILAVFL
ncbi:MAG TPA: potassium-transporting ATPase subunit KdpA, partial [Syntrophorhabdaceae bacterium]|nr:potassium-transporting ATPase subunit KdpA [Syntrophorhabdaceae bacterium]